ncbi:hypothetical protein KBD61_01370 [Patescibacteria group bacterium]|nr:hypothetical protein [Patescibacteria group bacterium]MBP9709659.1 hypothetical protein [Patescibacteria group bacterium]
MNNNQRINVDLKFLDKDGPIPTKLSESNSHAPPKPTQYNWVGILAVSGVIIILAALR